MTARPAPGAKVLPVVSATGKYREAANQTRQLLTKRLGQQEERSIVVVGGS
jgi:hypothetical protein